MARKRRWWIVAAGITLGLGASGTAGAQDGRAMDDSSPATWKAAGSSRHGTTEAAAAGAKSQPAGSDLDLPALPDAISGLTRGMEAAEPKGARPMMSAVKAPDELPGTPPSAPEEQAAPTGKMMPTETATAEKHPADGPTPGKKPQPLMVGVPDPSAPEKGTTPAGDSAEGEVFELPVRYPSPESTAAENTDTKTPEGAERPSTEAAPKPEQPGQKTQQVVKHVKPQRNSWTPAAPVAKKQPQKRGGIVQAQYRVGPEGYPAGPQAPPVGPGPLGPGCDNGPHGPVYPEPGWSCAHEKFLMQQAVLGFPSEFHESPLGYFLYAQARTMVANGAAARLALYQYDFCDHGEQLNPRGRDQVRKIAAMLPGCFGPVVIERTGCDPHLDEARRAVVLAELSQCGFSVPEERVVVGPPMAYGLHGVEADLVFRNLLIQTQTGGVQAGVGGGSIGGTVGQGFGATGRTASGR